MIERADALRHYGEVVALDRAVIADIQDMQPVDGLLQTPTTRAKVLHSFDPAGSGVEGHISYSEVSPVSRPLNYLIYRVLAEIEPDQDSVERCVIETFLNETLLPMTGIPDSDDAVAGTISATAPHYHACSEAEGYFDDALQQVTSPVQEYKHQRLVRVYHDSDRQPIAFGKSYNRNSALQLNPVNADGLRLPAGTIAGIDIGINEESGSYAAPGWGMVSYQVDESLGVRPYRLSAWAYPGELDRAIFAVSDSGTSYDVDYAKTTTSVTLAHFQEAASHMLALCGVVS